MTFTIVPSGTLLKIVYSSSSVRIGQGTGVVAAGKPVTVDTETGEADSSKRHRRIRQLPHEGSAGTRGALGPEQDRRQAPSAGRSGALRRPRNSAPCAAQAGGTAAAAASGVACNREKSHRDIGTADDAGSNSSRPCSNRADDR